MRTMATATNADDHWAALERLGWTKDLPPPCARAMKRHLRSSLAEGRAPHPFGKAEAYDNDGVSGEGDYRELLKRAAKASYGLLAPKAIEETWTGGRKPSCTLSFAVGRKRYEATFPAGRFVAPAFLKLVDAALPTSLTLTPETDSDGAFVLVNRAAEKAARKRKLLPKVLDPTLLDGSTTVSVTEKAAAPPPKGKLPDYAAILKAIDQKSPPTKSGEVVPWSSDVLAYGAGLYVYKTFLGRYRALWAATDEHARALLLGCHVESGKSIRVGAELKRLVARRDHPTPPLTAVGIKGKGELTRASLAKGREPVEAIVDRFKHEATGWFFKSGLGFPTDVSISFYRGDAHPFSIEWNRPLP